MSVVFNPQPMAVAPFQEPSRPAPQAHQESARPVIAPDKSEAAAQEAHRDEERRIEREQERKAEQRAAAERKPSGQPDNHDARPRAASGDINVGSLVDDYA